MFVVFTDIKGWKVETFADLQEFYNVADELALDVSTIYYYYIFYLLKLLSQKENN